MKIIISRLKKKVIEFHWIFSTQFGLDPFVFLLSIRGLPSYFIDWIRFRRGYSGVMSFKPCLHDRYQEGGATNSEYFWQDLLVARAIYQANPNRHVDVGSRVDGFISHVASFREIEVFDVRPITTKIPGVIFKQADFMSPSSSEIIKDDYCDSLSCLHAIEHFGLGRYGDPINPNGYSLGITNMAKLLRSKGVFYLAAPVGQNRVEFNANRIFDPREIIRCAMTEGLKLRELILISTSGYESIDPTDQNLLNISLCNYQLGMFIFNKV